MIRAEMNGIAQMESTANRSEVREVLNRIGVNNTDLDYMDFLDLACRAVALTDSVDAAELLLLANIGFVA